MPSDNTHATLESAVDDRQLRVRGQLLPYLVTKETLIVISNNYNQPPSTTDFSLCLPLILG